MDNDLWYLDERMVTNREVPAWSTRSRGWPANMPDIDIDELRAYSSVSTDKKGLSLHVVVWDSENQFNVTGKTEEELLENYRRGLRELLGDTYLVLLRLDVTAPRVVDTSRFHVDKADNSAWQTVTERTYILAQQKTRKAFKKAIQQLRWHYLRALIGTLPAAKL
jgi:hypothetical protein